MAHPDVLTAQERSARVLATLLSMRLPEADWSISTIYPDRLEGQLARHSRTPNQIRTDLTVWATVFNTSVNWHNNGGHNPEVVLTINDVTVRVWSTLDPDEEEAT